MYDDTWLGTMRSLVGLQCRVCGGDVQSDVQEGGKGLSRKGLVGQPHVLELCPGGTESSCTHLFSRLFIEHIY